MSETFVVLFLCPDGQRAKLRAVKDLATSFYQQHRRGTGLVPIAAARMEPERFTDLSGVRLPATLSLKVAVEKFGDMRLDDEAQPHVYRQVERMPTHPGLLLLSWVAAGGRIQPGVFQKQQAPRAVTLPTSDYGRGRSRDGVQLSVYQPAWDLIEQGHGVSILETA